MVESDDDVVIQVHGRIRGEEIEEIQAAQKREKREIDDPDPRSFI